MCVHRFFALFISFHFFFVFQHFCFLDKSNSVLETVGRNVLIIVPLTTALKNPTLWKKSSEDLSSSHNENNKRKTSTASKGGKPKILSIQEYEAELDLLTNEPKSSDDTDTGEYFSDEDDDNDKNEIKSFTLPNSSRLQLSVHYNDAEQEMHVNVIRANNVPGREAGGPSAYQINLSMEPDNKQYWQSKIRTAPNPEYLEEWKFQIPLVKSELISRKIVCFNVKKYDALAFPIRTFTSASGPPEVTIHKSTLICCIVGFFGNEEYLCGEAFLPFENLNLNIENILTVNFQPIHVLPVTHDLQLTKTEVETDDKSKIATSKLADQDRPSICPQNENAIIFNTRLSKVLLMLRLSQNTGRFECCIQQINLIGIRISKIPKRSIYVKLFIRTEEDGLINKAHSASYQQQSTIHMNETFAFYIKPYQIGRITVEFSLFKRKPFNKRIIIGTCKIGKYNTSINELEHWERVLATKDQVISQWHKFYPIAITPPEMTLKMED
ncbi:unnamed protein product [Schistosoma curassoni]|uniref:C2 domain-containing protein n=1 Tax=Schistosoma curassoni TaxID=6186 RepID=A0A3P8DA97_9TREM|nr:unnamed protein product [Schistosoma curassoni]